MVPAIKDLAEILPAGEWADVKSADESGTLMTEEDWGLFCRARSVREGGRPVFIKWFRPAPDGATTTTREYTGPSRLARVQDRIGRLRVSPAQTHLVEIVAVSPLAGGLMVAMDDVTPLEKLLTGPSVSLAATVLRDLDPEHFGGSWMHLDICPRNIGVTRQGKCVLIDLDSAYLGAPKTFRVRTPALKQQRLPRAMNEQLLDELAAQEITASTALRKMQQEVLLAATECVFGQFPASGFGVTRDQLAAWLSASPVDARLVAFFRDRINEAYFSNAPISIGAIRQGLEAIASAIPPMGVSPVPLAPVSSDSSAVVGPVPVETVGAAVAADGEPSKIPLVTGWEAAWRGVLGEGRQLRLDRLGRAAIHTYFERLERLRAEYPSQREVHDELLFVAIGYRRDPRLARDVAGIALAQFPGDAALKRWIRIIDNWIAERANG